MQFIPVEKANLLEGRINAGWLQSTFAHTHLHEELQDLWLQHTPGCRCTGNCWLCLCRKIFISCSTAHTKVVTYHQDFHRYPSHMQERESVSLARLLLLPLGAGKLRQDRQGSLQSPSRGSNRDPGVLP